MSLAPAQPVLATASPKADTAPDAGLASPAIEGAGDAEGLKLYPSLDKGMRTPFDLWRYYGPGENLVRVSPSCRCAGDQWVSFHERQKPKLMEDVRDYMNSRYAFEGALPLGGARCRVASRSWGVPSPACRRK